MRCVASFGESQLVPAIGYTSTRHATQRNATQRIAQRIWKRRWSPVVLCLTRRQIVWNFEDKIFAGTDKWHPNLQQRFSSIFPQSFTLITEVLSQPAVCLGMRCECETMWMFQVTVPQSDRHDTGVMYTKLTVKQLHEEAPGVGLRSSQFSVLRYIETTIITIILSMFLLLSLLSSLSLSLSSLLSWPFDVMRHRSLHVLLEAQ